MGFRVISNDEVVKALPTQKEMGKFEQLIRRNPLSIPKPASIVTKMLTKNPVPASIPVPKSIFLKPEPIVEPVAVPEPVPEIELDEIELAELASVIEPDYTPEPLPNVPPPPPPKPQPTVKKSSFDLPLGREHYSSEFHGRGNYIPVHIPPAVTEPLVIPDTVRKTTQVDADVWETPILPHHPKPVINPVIAPVIAPISIPANIIAERRPIPVECVYEFPDTAEIYGRKTSPVTTSPTRTVFQNTPLHLPKLDLSYQTGLITTFFIVRIVLGVAMIGFGIYTSGSYYGSAISKFSGDMALLFYRYQLGMILAFAGMIIIYDALRFMIRK